jgi:PhnB protein
MKEIVTYLNFDGTCRQAMEFYKNCLGGELFIMAFSEVPGALPPEAQDAKDRIMHATVSKGGHRIMASDSLPGMAFHPGNNFSVSIHCDSVEEAETLFAAFGEKGKVVMPLQETFWAARYGMLTDQFGMNWMFNLEGPPKS